MVDHIWGIFIIIGITYSFITGNIHEINTEIINAGTDKSYFKFITIINYLDGTYANC